MSHRKGESQGGAAVGSLKSQRKGGLGDRFMGLACYKGLLLTALLAASLVGALEVRR